MRTETREHTRGLKGERGGLVVCQSHYGGSGGGREYVEKHGAELGAIPLSLQAFAPCYYP